MQFREHNELFSFDRLQCLRTAYFHNDCQECLQICPKEALYFDRKKLSIDFDRCTNCSVCIGVCPTEALSLTFFDPNDYILQQSKNPHLSCKKDIPCLSAFDSEHFITAALRCEKVSLDLSHCQECELNPDGKTYDSIMQRVQEAKRFLQALGMEPNIEERRYEPDRRGFFKSIFQTTKQLMHDQSSGVLRHSTNKVPVKLTLLKNSIKQKAPSLPQTKITNDFSFLGNKRIDQNCTNCGDCFTFCPTDALFSAKDGAAIWMISGKCIDCDICNDICKPHAITDTKSIDSIAWAYDRGEELIAFQIEMCQECKTPFPYRGGEMVCERCKSFLDDFGDIFKLASEDET